MPYRSYDTPFEIATDTNFSLNERAAMLHNYIYHRGYGDIEILVKKMNKMLVNNNFKYDHLNIVDDDFITFSSLT